jgi:hypothetical protein
LDRFRGALRCRTFATLRARPRIRPSPLARSPRRSLCANHPAATASAPRVLKSRRTSRKTSLCVW